MLENGMIIRNPDHKIWWLWVPLAIIVCQLALEAVIPSDIMAQMMSENGPDELVQFAVIAAAFLVACWSLLGFPLRKHPWLAGYLILAALCCFYVSGEEISWGQWFAHWKTPETWGAINDQDETNLHNTSSWLDQKPRLLLEIAVMTGGLMIPLLRQLKPSLLPVRFNLLYPAANLGVTAGFVLALKLCKWVEHALGTHIFERVSEVIELYLYYFVLLYLVQLRQRFSVITSKNVL